MYDTQVMMRDQLVDFWSLKRSHPSASGTGGTPTGISIFIQSMDVEDSSAVHPRCKAGMV